MRTDRRVRMGAVGYRVHRGTQKQGTQNKKMSMYGIFVMIWSGKFPRTWCFVVFVKNGKKWVHMCENARGWVKWGVRSRGQGKNKTKRAQNGVTQQILWCVITAKTTQEVDGDDDGTKRVNVSNRGWNKGRSMWGKCVYTKKNTENTPKDQVKQ